MGWIAGKGDRLDDDVTAVRQALAEFELPGGESSRVSVRRTHWSSISVQVVSRKFDGLSDVERGDLVWPCLEELDDEIFTQLSEVSLWAPGEKRYSREPEPDDPLGILYHRTRGPVAVWAAVPSAPQNRHYAGYTFADVPTAERIKFLTDSGGRILFDTPSEAASAAFAEAERQMLTQPVLTG